MRKGQKATKEQCEHYKLAALKRRDYSGSNNPKWRGGKIKLGGNRYAVYAPTHPYANLFGGSHILEYRLIAEKKIGRYLLLSEIVHHIDGNVMNNHPDNLDVMTQSEHARRHGKETRREWALTQSRSRRKLTNEQVLEVRKLFIEGFSTYKIGKIFNMGSTTIKAIACGKTYKDV